MLHLQFLELLLVFYFSLFIIELAKYRVIIVGLPILAKSGLSLFFILLLCPFLIVLVIYACHNVELFWIVLNKCLLSLDWQLYFSVMEVKIWQLWVVYNIIGISNRAQLLHIHLRLGGLMLSRMQVHNVVGPLVLLRLSLNYLIITIWFMRDLARTKSSASFLLCSLTGSL